MHPIVNYGIEYVMGGFARVTFAFDTAKQRAKFVDTLDELEKKTLIMYVTRRDKYGTYRQVG